jgi:hypothetical protein
VSAGVERLSHNFNTRENVETHGVRLRHAGKPTEIYRPFLRDATFWRRTPCVSTQSAVFPETVTFLFPRPKNQNDEERNQNET